MTRTRTISINVSKMTGDVFDSLLGLPLEFIPDVNVHLNEQLPLIGFCKSPLHGSHKNKFSGTNCQNVDEKSFWNVPIHVISNGDFSEIIVILKQPVDLSDSKFEQRIDKISDIVTLMKHILESDV